MANYTIRFNQTGRTLRNYATEDLKKAKKRAKEMEDTFHTKTDVVAILSKNKLRKVC